MSERILYWGSGSAPCWRAMVVLEEKNLKYDSKLITFSKGEHKSPEILAINPRGQVPTFKDGDVIVNESLAIMKYLEDTYPSPPLMPKGNVEKAKALQMFHECQNLDYIMRRCFIAKMMDKDETAYDKAFSKLKTELAVWEGYLGKSEHLAGPDFTLADAIMGAMLISAMRFGATFEDFPNAKKYALKLQDRPSFAATYPPHWKEGAAENPFLAGKL